MQRHERRVAGETTFAALQEAASHLAMTMVDLVENGSFLFSPADTQAAVGHFAEEIFQRYPLIDALTLSSTHLPWLRRFFEACRPDCLFLDPAEDIVAGIGPGTAGTGIVQGLVTEDENYDLDTFRRMLKHIGVDIPLDLVRPEFRDFSVHTKCMMPES